MKKERIFVFGLILMMVILMVSCSKKKGVLKKSGEEVTTINVDYPIYENASDLIDASNLIVRGTVTDIQYEVLDISSKDNNAADLDSSSFPHTIYKIKVSEVYRGDFKEDTISIKRLGGIKDGIHYVLEGAEEIKKDGEYLFVAVSFEDSYPSFTNATQSTYEMGESIAKAKVHSQKGITAEQILDILKNQ